MAEFHLGFQVNVEPDSGGHQQVCRRDVLSLLLAGLGVPLLENSLSTCIQKFPLVRLKLLSRLLLLALINVREVSGIV